MPELKLKHVIEPEGDPLPPQDKISKDIHLLGDMLGETLIEQEGKEIFELEEKLRGLTKRARVSKKSRSEIQEQIISTVSKLSDKECLSIVHAFSTYFQLVNLVEDHHRIRVLREREAKFAKENQTRGRKSKPLRVAESAYDLVFTLKEKGFSLEETLDFFSNLRIELAS